MSTKLKKLMKPILKQKCSEAYQKGLQEGIQKGWEKKSLAYENEVKFLKLILKKMEQGKPAWIPVNERKPEEFVSVLIYVPGEVPLPTVHEAYYARGCWVTHITVLQEHEATHWMEMPVGPGKK